MKLILDNIIFCIQRMGGISVVWQELLQRALCDEDLDCTILDYDRGKENICRQSLQITNPIHMTCRRMERYRTPDFQVSEPALFHSSYFRVLRDSRIRNITTVHDLTSGMVSWAKHKAAPGRKIRRARVKCDGDRN